MDYPVIDITATGRNIDILIRDHGYTVTDIASYLGTTDSLVYRYIRGIVCFFRTYCREHVLTPEF